MFQMFQYTFYDKDGNLVDREVNPQGYIDALESDYSDLHGKSMLLYRALYEALKSGQEVTVDVSDLEMNAKTVTVKLHTSFDEESQHAQTELELTWNGVQEASDEDSDRLPA
jgi:hypothetical protein